MNGPGSIFDVFRKTMSLLDKRERRLSYVLMGVMIVVAFAELLGLSTLVLLLRVFSRPDLIETNRYLKLVNDIFQPGSVLAFQVIFSGLVFIVVLVSLGLRALGNYAIIRYSTMRGYTLSSRLLQAYLHQPYTWFLERNSAEVNKSVLSEVQGLVTRILVPGLKLLSSVILAIAIIGFLVVLDPVVALCAAGALGGGYALIYFWLRKRLVIIGQESLEANRERFRLTQEATGGFKEMKLLGLEDAYVARFRRPARRIGKVKTKHPARPDQARQGAGIGDKALSLKPLQRLPRGVKAGLCGRSGHSPAPKLHSNRVFGPVGDTVARGRRGVSHRPPVV